MLYYTLEYLPIFTGSKIRKKNINIMLVYNNNDNVNEKLFI